MQGGREAGRGQGENGKKIRRRPAEERRARQREKKDAMSKAGAASSAVRF